MLRIACTAMALAMPASAEPAGPPRPAPPPKLTPAQAAIAAYKAQYGAGLKPPPCVRKPGEITVCADMSGRSPDRIPLPDERTDSRHASEFNRVDIGTGPVPVRPGVTVARFGMGAEAKRKNATLKLIYAQEKAKEEQAMKAALAAEVPAQPATAIQTKPAKAASADRSTIDPLPR